jgi:hypothetical protein
VVLCLSQDGACTDSFENFRDNSLKGDLSNDISLTPPLFSLVNTFKVKKINLAKYHCCIIVNLVIAAKFLHLLLWFGVAKYFANNYCANLTLLNILRYLEQLNS